jgi:hypothetical protein
VIIRSFACVILRFVLYMHLFSKRAHSKVISTLICLMCLLVKVFKHSLLTENAQRGYSNIHWPWNILMMMYFWFLYETMINASFKQCALDSDTNTEQCGFDLLIIYPFINELSLRLDSSATSSPTVDISRKRNWQLVYVL